MSTFVVGISGASGAIYGIRLVQALSFHGHRLHVVFSATARSIVHDETGIDLGPTPDSAHAALTAYLGAQGRAPGAGELTVHGERNLYSAIASGSVPTDGMVVAPASMKTVAAIAHGYADGLLTRAADVHIKEGRPLVLVPRECPLSPIHLENLLKLSRLNGVRIVPAMPAFYTAPRSVLELVDFVVARILDSIAPGIEWSPRWQGAGGTRPADR
ncbi:MAG: UbiX family flavin prenyltransferase [Nitrospirae bacterium]|nr:UbiX family flavin prenyltransferase [Nitrospirota bacterium]